MDINDMALAMFRFIGFRNTLLLLCALGILMLLWLIFSLPGSRPIKTIIRIFCLTGLAALIGIIASRASLMLPTGLIRALCFLLAVTTMLIFLQMARTLLLVPSILLYPAWKLPLKAVVSRPLSLLVFFAGLALGTTAFCNTLRVPEIKEVTIPIVNLPPQLEQYHIIQITDTHLGTIFDEKWMEAVAVKAMEQAPDLLVFTGDIGEFAPSAIPGPLAVLTTLSASDGVYFILGNHEVYQGILEWVRFYQETGTLLRNSHVLLQKDGALLAVAGLDEISPDVHAALAGVPSTAIKVVLAHRPALAMDTAEAGTHLQLSGHTHGGLLPGIKDVAARANAGFVSGLYQVGQLWLYVSNGTGLWSYMPLRLNTPPEITSVRLVRAQD